MPVGVVFFLTGDRRKLRFQLKTGELTGTNSLNCHCEEGIRTRRSKFLTYGRLFHYASANAFLR
jgi:hypothetical protein